MLLRITAEKQTSDSKTPKKYSRGGKNAEQGHSEFLYHHFLPTAALVTLCSRAELQHLPRSLFLAQTRATGNTWDLKTLAEKKAAHK